VCEAAPEGGKVAVFISNLTKNNTKERKLGFEETEKQANKVNDSEEKATTWETIDYFTDHGDAKQTKENILKVLNENEDIACLVGMNGYHGPIILEVLEEAGKLGKVKVVAFDEADATLQGVADGHIHGTIAQDPYLYGYQAIRMLTSLNNGDSSELPLVGGGAVNVQTEAIRKDDVEAFKEKLSKRLKGTPVPKAETKKDETKEEPKKAA